MVIRKIEDLESKFLNQKFKINVFLSKDNDFNLIDNLVKNSENDFNNLFIFFKKNHKLISLDFSKNYKINNYALLDRLSESRKIDYSIELL